MENYGTQTFQSDYPVFAIECERFLPNRFGVVLAAAARARQLNRGDTTRIVSQARKAPQIALGEIAAGVFGDADLSQLLGLDRPAAASGAIEVDRPDGGPSDEKQLLEGMMWELATRPCPPTERLNGE